MQQQKKYLSRKLVSGGLCGTGTVTLALLAGLSFSTGVLAQENTKKTGKMEYFYNLDDESMLGRYGDENDEYIANASVPVSSKPMTSDSKKNLPRSGEKKIGAFSLKDGSQEGHYGDGIYNVSED